MLGALLILLAMPVLDTGRVRGSQFRPLMRVAFWVLVADFFLLMYIGSQHAEEPYVTIGAVATVVYFGWFLVLVPTIGVIENTLIDVARTPDNSPLLIFNFQSTGKLEFTTFENLVVVSYSNSRHTLHT